MPNRLNVRPFSWYPPVDRCIFVTRELWQQVQDVLDDRGTRKTCEVSEQLAFSGLITCGDCGCALVGEIKKGRYVYYHCTGFKGKCPVKYTREEVLEQQFIALLKSMSFGADVLTWVTQARRESDRDARVFHGETIRKLEREHNGSMRCTWTSSEAALTTTSSTHKLSGK